MLINKKPLFSIVVPTKNRAEFCLETVMDLLRSDFNEFEIVVVDNDDSDDTHLALNTVKDLRLRRIRTGGLSMHDNWQRGFEEAKGAYVFMGEDKITLRKDALSVLARRINVERPPLLVWVNSVREFYSDYQCSSNNSQTVLFRRMPSSSTLKMVRESDHDNYSYFGPHAINCVFDREFGLGIQKQRGRLFQEISPDYWSGLMILAHCPEYLHTQDKLGCILSRAPSNGRDVRINPEATKDFFRRLSKPKKEFLEGMPSSADIPINYLLADFRRALQICGVSLEYGLMSPSLGNYFLALSLDLIRYNAGNTDQSREWQDLRRDFALYPKHVRMWALFLSFRKLFYGWPNSRNGFLSNLNCFISCWRMLKGV